MSINCDICTKSNPSTNLFCGHCGAKIGPLDVETVHQRLLELEAQLGAGEQKYLEVDTAEKVQKRVVKWAAAYIGCGIILFAVLTTIVGKDISSLNNLAATARQSVQPIIDDATKKAGEAQKLANDSLQQVKSLESNVRSSQERVASLNTELANQKDQIGRLASIVNEGQLKVKALQAQVDSQTQSVVNLQKITNTAVLSKNKESISAAYPMFGQHFAQSRQGIMDPSQKKQGTDWVVLDIVAANSYRPSLREDDIAKAESQMQADNFVPFVGGVSLVAQTRTVTQGVGMGFYDGSCQNIGHFPSLTPCILYFNPQKRTRALVLQSVLKTAMNIPDEDIRYIDPETQPDSVQELLRLSGVDFVVELVSK